MTKPTDAQRNERLARKLSLAGERDTRVMIARTPDTHRILDIVRNADRGVRIIRSNLLIRFTPDEVIPILNKYHEAIKNLHIVTGEICGMAGVPYRPPRGMEEPSNEANEQKEPIEAAAVEEDRRKKKKPA